MKLKHKLHAGFLLLFLVVLIFGALSLFYIRLISNSNTVILNDNYATLGYTNQMRTALEGSDVPFTSSSINKFRSALSREENNITEKGELEAVRNLSRNFKDLEHPVSNKENQLAAAGRILNDLNLIDKINLKAIQYKSQDANQGIKNATTYLGVVMAFTFIILFSFVFNLADFFEEPLTHISEGLNEVSLKNYKFRLNFDRKDEFGEVSETFNMMAEKLEKISLEQNANLLTEKALNEAIINLTPDPIIGLNNLSEILFINPAGERLFNLDHKIARGIHISKLNSDNQPLQDVLTSGHDSLVKINAVNYQLAIQEIIITPKQISPFGADMSNMISGKSVGKIYTLKQV